MDETPAIGDDERIRYLKRLAAEMPTHIREAFLAEAAERPDELPSFARDVHEAYPDPQAWRAGFRAKALGILHWQWADGSGFPRWIRSESLPEEGLTTAELEELQGALDAGSDLRAKLGRIVASRASPPESEEADGPR
jgi:hypothetical protein